MAKFVTNAAMWSLNLVQVRESISGSVVPLAMFLVWALHDQASTGEQVELKVLVINIKFL